MSTGGAGLGESHPGLRDDQLADKNDRLPNTALMGADPERSPIERRLARNLRAGLMDLALIALFWLIAALDIWPPLYAAVATGLFALFWTTDFVGLRLALRLERRESAEAEPAADSHGWRPGERGFFAYLIISSVVLYAVVISVAWIAVHFDVASRGFAIPITIFLSLVALVAGVMLWVAIRRALRERVEESHDHTA